MLSQVDYNDVVANNVANASSNGFKKSSAVFKQFDEVMVDKLNAQNKKDFYEDDSKSIGKVAIGAGVDRLYIDFSQGSLFETGNPLNVAINGDGFFAMKTSDNKDAYTRNGSFLISSNGFLKDNKGNNIIGDENKPIKIENNQIKDLTITQDGTISTGTQRINRIKIVDFSDKNELLPVGNSTFIDSGKAGVKASKNYELRQGMVETSNSNIITEMVNSISGSRAYEAMTSMVKMTDGTLQKNINEVGRVQ
jgi:flagellar basal-body rod protein FlgF